MKSRGYVVRRRKFPSVVSGIGTKGWGNLLASLQGFLVIEQGRGNQLATSTLRLFEAAPVEIVLH